MKIPRLLVAAVAFATGVLPSIAALQSAQPLPDNAMPMYPPALIGQGITRGRAVVAVSIDETGRVQDTLTLAYTSPQLARSAVEAVKDWRFAPAQLDGVPVPVQMTLKFDFTVQGAVISTNIVNHFLFDGYGNVGDDALVYRPGDVAKLDHPPVRIGGEDPKYALQAASDGVRGTVAVQFYIDETGAVRLPAVAEGAHPYLMEQAVDAVRSWKFQPLRSRGEPVLVLARQEFRFGTTR